MIIPFIRSFIIFFRHIARVNLFFSSLLITCVWLTCTLSPLTTFAEPSEPAQSAQSTGLGEEIAQTTRVSPRVPDAQWAFSNQLAARYNPLGLQNELYIGYKKRLYQKPQDNLLFGKSFWWAGAIVRATPQFMTSGLFVRASPIAVLELHGEFTRALGLSQARDLPGYYTQGTQDAVASTQSAQNPEGMIISSGWQGSAYALLQAKVGHIAIRSKSLARHFNLNGEGDRTQELFYDQALDLVTPLKGWVYQADNDLLYADANKPWVLGARHTYATSLSDSDTTYSIHRLGFLFAWKFKAPPTDQGLEAARRHALIVLSQWHLDHPFRTGQSMHTAIPYFVVAYSLSGRL